MGLLLGEAPLLGEPYVAESSILLMLGAKQAFVSRTGDTVVQSDAREKGNVARLLPRPNLRRNADRSWWSMGTVVDSMHLAS